MQEGYSDEEDKDHDEDLDLVDSEFIRREMREWSEDTDTKQK